MQDMKSLRKKNVKVTRRNKMKIYISGAISNNPNYREDFEKAEKYLKEKHPDAETINPVKLVKPTRDEIADFKSAFKLLMECDAIYAIKKDKHSSLGIIAEIYYALRCNYKFVE